jgi:hypothetical protein
MFGLSAGDLFFIVLILGVVHGIMFAVDRVRRRKASQRSDSDPN